MRTKQRTSLFVFLVIFIIISIFMFFIRIKGSQRINVILITVDALRADNLSCYGYERDTSPNIDNFAKEGAVFTQAIAQASWTWPSLSSVLTSTYPRTHGMYLFDQYLTSLEFDDLGRLLSLPTLAQILKERGYRTGFISGYELLTTIYGIKQGFDPIGNNIFEEQGRKGEAEADIVTQYAIRWLRKNRGDPFFLWIHYLGPHGPYRPPSPYNKMYLYDDLYRESNKNIPIGEKQWDGYGVIPGYAAEGGITDVNYYISQYDGEISFTDEYIGVLLRELEKLGLDKETLVVFSADHGEGFGEHNLYFMHGLLYDEMIKVPLIIRYPKLIPRDKMINTQVQSIDIMPTILDILKIESPETTEGFSLMPLILEKGKYSSPFAFSDTGMLKSIRTGDWKLIVDDGTKYMNMKEWQIMNKKESGPAKYELYNLREDPKELNNLAETEKDVLQFLKQKLDSWMSQAQPRAAGSRRPLTEEIKEQLRSLGYLQ